MGVHQLLLLSVVLIMMPHRGHSVVKRCFSCRSRGDLGDCRDPFYLSANSTLTEDKETGVEMPPCASGWCRKIEEGGSKLYKDAEFGSATQRDCMQRPPSDGKERCAEVELERRMVNLCMCKGDLCNLAGIRPLGQWLSLAVGLLAAIVVC